MIPVDGEEEQVERSIGLKFQGLLDLLELLALRRRAVAVGGVAVGDLTVVGVSVGGRCLKTKNPIDTAEMPDLVR